MAKLIKFRDLSDSYRVVSIENGKTVKDSLPEITDWGNWIVLVNGKKDSESHVISEDDYIIVRAIPRSLTAIAVGLAIASFAGAVFAGYQGYKARKQAAAAEKELEKIRNATSDEITNLPYLAGASNTVATGRTQPYIIGHHLFTPYILNGGNNYKGYHTIAGTYGADSYYTVVLEGGFNNQILESLSCDDVKVANLLTSDLTPQENDATTPKFYFTEDSVFASDDSYIEIAQDGNPFENDVFNKKVVEQELSDQLRKADDDDYEDLYYTLETNTKRVEVGIMFNGLFATSSSGTKTTRTVEIIPEYSLDYAELAAAGNGSSATWTAFNFTHPVTSTTETLYIGYYSYTVTNYKYLYKNSYVLAHLDDLTFESGTDVRNMDGVVWGMTWSNTGAVRVSGIYQNTTTTTTDTESNTFSYNLQKQLRFMASHDFSYADNFEDDEARSYPITIRLRCPTNKVTSGSETSDCYVEWVHSYCFNVEDSLEAGSLVDESLIGENEAARSTLIGVHIKATSSNEEKIKKINVITNGLAPEPTYDEDTETYTWDTDTKGITSNPASWLVEVLTSHTHAASQCSVSELDLQAFGALWTHCDENGIEVNLVLTNSQKKSEVLDAILNTCHAVLYQNIYGLISVAFDDVKENALALFNEQNIINLSFEKSVRLEVDGIRATYIDRDSNYQENSFVELYDADATYGEDSTLREVSLEGITSVDQAYQHAFYLMANEKLRPIKISIQVGREGIFFTPFSKILVQHPSLKIGLGNAVVKSTIILDGEIIGVELYDPVMLSSGYTFTTTIQCVSGSGVGILTQTMKFLIDDYLELTDGTYFELTDGTNLELRVTPGEEDGTYFTNIIYFGNPVSEDADVIPHAGDVLSYGYEADTVTRELTIFSIKPNGTEGYILECYDYDEAIFDFDSGRIPEYSPVITERRTPAGSVPSSIPSDTPTYAQSVELIQTLTPGIATAAAEGVAEEIVAEKTPTYLGVVTSVPGSANPGDWFTWNGNSSYTVGRVYKYVNNSWIELEESDPANGKELMAALKDILSLTATSGGYFSSVFSNVLIANAAFINKLAATIITLQQDSDGNGGLIKSDNYNGTVDSSGTISAYGNTGWAIDYNGTADFANMNATGGTFSGITVDGSSLIKGFIQNNTIMNKLIGGVYFIDQDTSNTASSTNNYVMGKIKASDNIKNIVKCGTGKYVIIFTDLDSDYGTNISNTQFSYRIIKASTKLYSVSTTYGSYGAAKYRYGYNAYQCQVQPCLPIRNQSTGNFSIDDWSYVGVTLDSNNYPVSLESHWYNGTGYETWTSGGVTYWALGLVVAQNNIMSSVFGGCQLLIEASRLSS